MSPSGEAGWPESLRPLYEGVTGTPAAEAVAASARWKESFAQWVKGASLDERTVAQVAAWERLASGERTPGELLFLLAACGELLWPYAEPPQGLLPRLLWRQEAVLESLRAAGDEEGVNRVRRETDAVMSTVLSRYLKRHPESLLSLVGEEPCAFDGRALRFRGTVEVDLKQVLGTGTKSVHLLEQLRALLPVTPAEGRDRLAEFIRTRAARIPWHEASEVLAERLFALATSPEGRGGMSGFLACYPNGRRQPDWCARAGLLLSRTLEAGGPPEVVENLCELLARFDAPPVDGLRGALGALVSGDFESAADLGPVRFVLDHCQATLRKGEPGLVLTLLWLEERLFRAGVRKGLPDAFERRARTRMKLEKSAPGFEHLCWLAQECAELWPRFSGVRPGLDELAAWRQEVATRMGRKPVLRKAAIEFFLWCAPDAASSEAELTVLALVRTATDRRQVKKFKEHPSARVRLRVRTLQTWLQGGGKAAPAEQGPATLTEALRHLHVSRAVPLSGRTWLRDRDLEELLLGTVARVEGEFATRYPERFREDTSELVADLLEALRRELERVKSDLGMLLAQGQPAPLELGLTVRRVEPEAASDAEASGPETLELGFSVPQVQPEQASGTESATPAEPAVSPEARTLEAEALPDAAAGGSEAQASGAEAKPDAVAGSPEAQVLEAEALPAAAAGGSEAQGGGAEALPSVAAGSSEAQALEAEALPAVAAGSSEAQGAGTEAKPAAGLRPSGVTVAFVVKVEVEGFLRAERVVLVQVVKLEQRGEGQWMPAFRLGREHVDSLLLRTDAAFCLFLAPPFPRAECWMVPARLVRGMMEAQRSLSGVAREGVQRAARSLAHWLVGDVVGLWTGDERPEWLEQVRASRAGASFVVELSLQGGGRGPG